MTSITGQPPSFTATVDVIRSEHINAARASVRNPEILKDLEAEIERDCDTIKSFLHATQVCNLHSGFYVVSLTCVILLPCSSVSCKVIDEISPRSRDSIIGFGERLGCKLITAVLRDRVSSPIALPRLLI